MKGILAQIRQNRSVRLSAINAAFWFVTLLYLETVLHLRFFDGFAPSYLFAVGFTAAIALILSAFLGCLPKKANGLISAVLVTLVSLVFASQIVYDAVFGTMYSLSLVGLGGAAITSFWKEVLLTIAENIPILLAILLPIPAAWILRAKVSGIFSTELDWFRPVVLLAGLGLHFAVVACLALGGTGYYSDYYFYHSNDTTTDQAAERFGLISTMRLEAMGHSGKADLLDPKDPVPEFEIPETVAPQPTQEVVEDPEDPTVPTEAEITYNTLEIDFQTLSEMTKDKALRALNDYVASLAPTNRNEYTGMLADYNLITICAESFATGAIHPELTPTLYKLANEGIVFNNFYNSYPNVTTDGEYSFCLGIWPDTTRSKSTASFYASRESYLPFALGNVFAEQAQVKSYAYHNYQGSYYGRDETHPNMGYTCKFAGDGMRFSTSWPSSDLEMMEQSVQDFIAPGEQFHAYYMTFSGHYKYSRSVNPMAARNYAQVQHLDMSEPAKCYISCHIELDKALEYLMNALEEAGIADKTAIVLTGDHFPYGLKDAEYEELVGYELDRFNKYKSTLIFWVGGLEEPIYVDDYCCNIDVLPTILNLWGFQYDSRLLAGRDVFSDSEDIAILRDQSFLTEKVWFNASNGKATWLVDESTVDPNYLENHIRMVKNQFVACSSILNEAYYNFLFEKGRVEISDDSWRPTQPPEEEPPEEVTPPAEETTPPQTPVETTPPENVETTPPQETTSPEQEESGDPAQPPAPGDVVVPPDQGQPPAEPSGT